MPKPSAKKRKKPNALAAAASRRLEKIGGRELSPEHLAHMMLHAEEDGHAERVPLEDGTWAWRTRGDDGTERLIKPTPDMLAALERFAREGHPAH